MEIISRQLLISNPFLDASRVAKATFALNSFESHYGLSNFPQIRGGELMQGLGFLFFFLARAMRIP
jgi:hypothetical protein